MRDRAEIACERGRREIGESHRNERGLEIDGLVVDGLTGGRRMRERERDRESERRLLLLNIRFIVSFRVKGLFL